MSEQAHTRWEVGQHPAISRGWIVRPVLFGSRVRVLPEHEGGHVLLLNEDDARLIAAAPDLLEALKQLLPRALNSDNPNISDDLVIPIDLTMGEIRAARAAIARATPSKSGGK